MATIFSPSALFSSTTTNPTKPPQTPPSTKPNLHIPPSNSKSSLTTTLTTTLTATDLATAILTTSPPSLADTPTCQLYYGTAASAANYGGYGGNSSKKDSAEHIYEVPDGWKERLVSKVEKGTNGTDSEFYNPKKKSESEYLTFLAGFRQLAVVLNNLALSNVYLQDLMASADRT
ncbi:thylakoid lumenal 19 kDa protein, chloroplastic [Quercus suber]|uniref:Thylakoid lumenal 19 kDa protein n=1 Tax=Quercus suber TaxID=58331 RepID=A0AAW0ISV7_QUESU|nr:thylakoid lumenal 19 kDa protein, chloroplastic-like [Quercus suber]POE45956.1 thylakoid lumenal 19 kda protein, chloroplastic [Quercus suber]